MDGDGPVQPTGRGWRLKFRWRRVILWAALGAVVVVLALGLGFYLWFHGQVAASNSRLDPAIVEALKETPITSAPASTTTISGSTGTTTAVSPSTTSTTSIETPSGMNIVLVGYDTRPQGSKVVTEGRSDTIILVHVDPEKDFLSFLSVPRDLLADVPGYGLYKINAAYAFGGGPLLIRTIQSGLGVDLDHFIGLDLQAFTKITDALGGVYMDVDRRYFNNNGYWESIDLQPGYQLLKGADALDYVRFRHDSNINFGRMERQQQFLAAVRQQALKWNLPLKLPGLVKSFFGNVDTDLSANELIKLAYWVVRLDGSRIKRREIVARTGTIHGAFYVLPTEKELKAAVEDFLTAPKPGAKPGTGGAVTSATLTPATLTPAALGGAKVDVVNATGRIGQGAFAAVWLSRQGASVREIREAEEPLLQGAVVRYPAGRARTAQAVAQALGIEQVQQASRISRVTVVLAGSYSVTGQQVPAGSEPSPANAAKWRSLAKTATFPLVAPSYIPETLDYSFGRSYDIVPGDKGKPAIRVGYLYDNDDQYVGISQTTWVGAPLASPGVEVQVDGVVYTVVGTSNKVDHVWWVKDGVLRWVSNTLFSELTREQLLAIAISTVPVPTAG